MNFKDNASREVFAAVEFHYSIDVVFPKGVFETTIDGTGVIFGHKIKVINGSDQEFPTGKMRTKINTK